MTGGLYVPTKPIDLHLRVVSCRACAVPRWRRARLACATPAPVLHRATPTLITGRVY
jgi:hypothetical protein